MKFGGKSFSFCGIESVQNVGFSAQNMVTQVGLCTKEVALGCEAKAALSPSYTH